MNAPHRLWKVSGSCLVPGTREKISVSPIRVSAPNQQKASADLVGFLMETMTPKIRKGSTLNIGAHFALLNLKWEDVTPAPIPEAPKA